ncbi:hypothetical protein ACPA54_29835 [Uniformispora flossi]|uniref:hypothetical protein n=1 Tax=Uniformispora flossi TaxID=3390723 RepID=UPI003C2ACDCC
MNTAQADAKHSKEADATLGQGLRVVDADTHCLYPDSLGIAARAMRQLAPDVVQAVMQDNAVRLYNLPLPR